MLRGDKIGEGTFGIVYTCKSPDNSNHYAVKRNFMEDKTSFIGAVRELDILKQLRNHPHIVKLEKVVLGDVFKGNCASPINLTERQAQKEDRVHFAFQEAFCDVHKFIYGTEDINYTQIVWYMCNILLGVEYIHSQKIIHRDIKPSNVLIFEESNTAKICDFGLAKPYTYQGIQTPKKVTSWYRAPEITLDVINYDYKSDIWSVGCVFFEMMARSPFISVNDDDNTKILEKILSHYPEKITLATLRRLSRNSSSNRKFNSRVLDVTRTSFKNQINLTQESIDQFTKEVGNYDLFCDLLKRMICFDWNTRFTATECLNHSIFDIFRTYINETRSNFPLKVKKPRQIVINNCIERTWMRNIAIIIYNNRTKISWYNHRILFQAIDLYDRYLTAMFNGSVIPPNVIESEYKGLIHSKHDAELRFMVCVYLAMKYFPSSSAPVEFDNVVLDEFATPQSKLQACQFEENFVRDCLRYNIYEPTVYESADNFNYILTEEDISYLINIYLNNSSCNGMTHSELFSYYFKYIKSSPPSTFPDILFAPIDKNKLTP